jgi:hypothetical protein
MVLATPKTPGNACERLVVVTLGRTAWRDLMQTD